MATIAERIKNLDANTALRSIQGHVREDAPRLPVGNRVQAAANFTPASEKAKDAAIGGGLTKAVAGSPKVTLPTVKPQNTEADFDNYLKETGRAVEDIWDRHDGTKRSYFSPSEWGTEIGKYETAVADSEKEAAAAGEWVKTAQERMQAAEKAYLADPSNLDAYRKYQSAYNVYSRIFGQYEPKQQNYAKAVDDYNNYVTDQQAKYDEWRGTVRGVEDVEAERSRIDASIKKLEQEQAQLNVGAYSNDPAKRRQKSERYQEIENEITQLRAKQATLFEELNWAKYFSYGDMSGNADFAEKSVADGSKQGQNFIARMFGNNTAAAYDYINNVGGYRDATQKGLEARRAEGAADASSGFEAYDYMTAEQKSTFTYIYNTQGAEAAQSYLNWLKDNPIHGADSLNAQLGKKIAEGVNNPVQQIGYGLSSGLNQFGTGIQQVFNKQGVPTSAVQFAGQQVREDLAEVGPKFKLGEQEYSLGQTLYDAAQTGANMAPSILVTMLTGGLGAPALIAQGAGAATLGLSAGGNAYNQALKEGKSEDEAKEYGLMIGAAEGGLQYLLGGISKLGGALPAKMLNKVEGIDNALARIAATGAIKIGSEITEEELQNFIEPALRTLIFDESYEAPNFEELAYTALLTAITTGIMESGNILTAGGTTYHVMGEAETAAYEALVSAGMSSGKATKIMPELMRVIEGDESINLNDLNKKIKLTDNRVKAVVNQLTGANIDMNETKLGPLKEQYRRAIELAAQKKAAESAALEKVEAAAEIEPQTNTNIPEMEMPAEAEIQPQNVLDNEAEPGYSEINEMQEEQVYGREESTDNRGRQDSGRADSRLPNRQGNSESYETGRDNGRGDLGVHDGELIPEKTRKIMTDKGIPNVELGETTDRGAFSAALDNAKAANPKGGMVDSQSPEDLQKNGSRTFMRVDGMAGVAVERDGNIVGVFKNPEYKQRGTVKDLVLTAIANGGNHLDCYATYGKSDLRYMYSKLGFKPVCYLEFNREYAPDGWNYEEWGEPDVVLWVHNGDTVEQIVDNSEGYHVPTRDEIHALPKFEDYDEAKAFQKQKLEEMQRSARLGKVMDGVRASQEARGAEAPAEVKRTSKRDRIMQSAVKKMMGADKKLTSTESAIALGKKIGVEVRAEKPSNGAEAQYENGVMLIDPDSKNPIMQMFVHELTHHIENSGAYQRFSEIVGKYISESLNVDLEYMKRVIKEDYAEGGIELDDDGAMREVVAKFCEGKLFNDEEAILRLAQTDRNLFQRIYDWIVDTVAKVGASEETKFLIDAQRMYEKALRSVNRGPEGYKQNSYGASFDELATRAGGYAAPMYSKLQREIEAFRGDKIGASSAVSYLRGKGVKAEEIKWSGIETFLEGKKSVGKQELLDWLRENELTLTATVLGETEPNDYYHLRTPAMNPDTGEAITNWGEFENQAYEMADRMGYTWDDVRFDENDGWWQAYINDPETGLVIDLMEINALGEDGKVEAETRWEDYKTPGGSNYREYLFKMPGSDYINDAMSVHWNDSGILAHARVQDFNHDGKPVLFIEEIQSDWHNAGAKQGYASKERAAKVEELDALERKYTWGDALLKEGRDRIVELRSELYPEQERINKEFDENEAKWRNDPTLYGLVEYVATELFDGNTTRARDYLLQDSFNDMDLVDANVEWLTRRYEMDIKPEEHEAVRDYYRTLWRLRMERHELDTKKRNDKYAAPEAPYAKNYHEYVLKNLLRKAAEGDYGYLAWTPGAMQEERWSSEYAEGYRIEYDQDIPKFLNKYGKQWGAKVGRIGLDGVDTGIVDEAYIDSLAERNSEIRSKLRTAQTLEEATQLRDEARKIQAEVRKARLGTVWAIPITKQMRDSVLYEGQPMYSAGSSFDELVQRAQAKKEADTQRTQRAMELFKQKQNEQAVPANEPTRRDMLMQDTVRRMMGLNRPADDGLGAADADFAGETLDYQDWVEQGGEVQEVSAEQAANVRSQQGREAEQIPVRNTFGRLTSKHAQTLINSGITTDSMAESLKSALANGAFSRMAYKDTTAMRKAEKTIERDGWEKTLASYEADVKAGKVSKDLAALGIALYNNAVTNGDNYTAMDIASLMVETARSAAQALQANRMLNKLTPEGRLYMVVRSVENMQDELRQRYGDEAPELEVDADLLMDYRDALESGDETAIDEAWEAIEQNIADQMPASWYEKLNTWRYLAMLGNPRTHIRNIVGNLGFAPVRLVKQIVGAGLERAVLGKTGAGSERTKAILNLASASDRALIQAAWMDFSEVEELVLSGGKYDDNRSSIQDKRTIYKLKPLEKVRKANSAALDIEDSVFSRTAYTEALASYLKAHGVDAVDYMNGNITEEAQMAAREYAIKEAQKATYRDINQFSEFVAKLGREGRNKDASKVSKAAGIVVEGTLPFKKTPANILVRAVEYSPIEFGLVLFNDMAEVKRGNMSTSEMLDHISSGLTGTGIVALGALLRAMGVISGGADDDEKQAAFNELRGQQEYAMTVGSKNFTLDWLAPEALPLFVGVELYDAFTDEDGEGSAFTRFINALPNIAEPMLNMSMLSSVNDLISNVAYVDEGSELWSLLAQAGVSYLQQYLPTLFGQIERVTEGERETTFTDRNKGISTDAQYNIGKSLNKLPGDYAQVPYIDAWGRTESSGGVVERVFNNMINPAYVSEDTSTVNDDELQRLYDAGYTNVFPTRAAQSTKVGDVYMTAEEYVEYATIRGGKSLEYVTELLQSNEYKVLTDKSKAEAIAQAYARAQNEAEEKVLDMRGEPINLSDKEESKRGLSSEDYASWLTYSEAFDALDDKDGVTDEEAASFDALVQNFGELDEEVQKLLLDKDGFAKAYAASEAGMSSKTFFDIQTTVKAAEVPEGYANQPNWNKNEVIMGMDISETDKLTAIKQNHAGSSTEEKIQTAYDSGIPLEEIVAYYTLTCEKGEDGKVLSKVERRLAAMERGFENFEMLERIFK